MTRTSYTVVYRTGGTERCEWHRTINYATRRAADVSADSVRRMGYKALVKPAADVDDHGLPVGWELPT